MASHFDVIESFLLEIDGLDEQLETISSVATAEELREWGLDDSVRQKTTKHKRKKRLNPTWLKRKNELQALREQTRALQTQVNQLETKHSAVHGSLPKVQKLRTKALVEEHRRRTAQDENEQLKTKLQRCAKQSESFKKSLATAEAEHKEFLRGALLFARALNVEVVGAGRQLLHSSSKVFDMLERKVDAKFLEIDHFLTMKQRPMLPGGDKLVETTGSNKTVEFSRLTLLPFDEKTMSSAMWSFVRMGKFPNSKYSNVTHRTDDTFVMTFRVTVEIGPGDVIHIETHGVGKRFVTAEGSAILMEACSAWTANFPSSGTWKHTTQEGSCFVLREYSPEGGAPPGICQGRSTLRLEPGELGKNSRHYPLAMSCTIKEVVIPSYRQLVHARTQFMENALFDVIRSQTES